MPSVYRLLAAVRTARIHWPTSASPSVPAPAARATIRTVAALLPLLLAGACSGKGTWTGRTDLPPACDAFVTKYETCMTAALPSLPAVARERAAQTRAALVKEVERANDATSSAAAANLTALATKCQGNLQRLAATCGSSRKDRASETR